MSGWRVIVSKDLDLDVDNCVVRVRQQEPDVARVLVEYLRATVIRIVRRDLPRRAAEGAP